MQSVTNRCQHKRGTEHFQGNPATPFPLREDLEIHIQGTDCQIMDPLHHQKEIKVVERAKRAIKESNNTGITYWTDSTDRIMPSGDIILRAENLDVEQLQHILLCKATNTPLLCYTAI